MARSDTRIAGVDPKQFLKTSPGFDPNFLPTAQFGAVLVCGGVGISKLCIAAGPRWGARSTFCIPFMNLSRQLSVKISSFEGVVYGTWYAYQSLLSTATPWMCSVPTSSILSAKNFETDAELHFPS